MDARVRREFGLLPLPIGVRGSCSIETFESPHPPAQSAGDLSPARRGGLAAPLRIAPDQTGSRREAGFTLIEVLVALVVISVALTAIGSLIATTVHGAR